MPARIKERPRIGYAETLDDRSKLTVGIEHGITRVVTSGQTRRVVHIQPGGGTVDGVGPTDWEALWNFDTNLRNQGASFRRGWVQEPVGDQEFGDFAVRRPVVIDVRGDALEATGREEVVDLGEDGVETLEVIELVKPDGTRVPTLARTIFDATRHLTTDRRGHIAVAPEKVFTTVEEFLIGEQELRAKRELDFRSRQIQALV